MGRFPTCSICIESMGDFSDVGCCPCGHAFHHRCLVEWTKEGAHAACPTCMTRFDNSPPGSRIKKLFFSFEKDSKAVEFSNEYLAQQMDLNENLEAQVRERNVEIERRKQQLTNMEAALAKEKDLAKKALDDREARLKAMQDSKETVYGLWKKEETNRIRLEDAVMFGKENLKQTQTALEGAQKKNSTLTAEVKKLRKENDELNEQVAMEDEESYEEGFEEGYEESYSSRHIIIRDLHDDYAKEEIKHRVWPHDLKFLGMYSDYADVVFTKPGVAQWVVDSLSAHGWNVCFATLEEEKELERCCLFVSNINYHADIDRVRGFSGNAIIACYSAEAANSVMEAYQNLFFYGRHLCVELVSY